MSPARRQPDFGTGASSTQSEGPGPRVGFRLESEAARGTLKHSRASATGARERGGPLADVETAQEQGVYVISVAARIVEMHPQTLRKYERVRLVTPSRTLGMLRLYSNEDIARLRLIKHLVGDLGLNLAGVHLALGLFNHMLAVRGGLDNLEGTSLKKYLNDRLDEIFHMLHTQLIRTDPGGEGDR